jgi:hypothetical protein
VRRAHFDAEPVLGRRPHHRDRTYIRHSGAASPTGLSIIYDLVEDKAAVVVDRFDLMTDR